MIKSISIARGAVLAGVVLATAGLFLTVPVRGATNSETMTVTAVGKKQPTPRISQSDVMLYENKERMQVLDWKPGEKLYLTVLIDDAVESSTASQLGDIRDFINAQPKTTYVAVAYTRNGGAQILQDFTTDHAKAGKALRIPLGTFGAFGSPYLSLQDLIKRLPETHDRRAIVFITSGIDYFRGNFTPYSPDLDTTIEHAQRENVTVYTIYARGVGHLSRNWFVVNNAQSSLSQLGFETGGEAFYLGFGTAVAYKPYLDEIRDHLNNQYLLTFQPAEEKKGKFVSLHVATELPKVQFLAPSHVYVPKSE